MKSSTYVLLTRALKNAGDFLIARRGRELLSHLRPDRHLRELNAWEPLEPYIEEINAARALIICGGPGIQQSFWPVVYPLTQRLQDIRVPIVLLAVGWYHVPGDAKGLEEFSFSSSSLAALRYIRSLSSFFSCRDYLTQQVLERCGMSDTTMTGCVTWYSFPELGKALQRPRSVTSVAFTAPARQQLYPQAADILSRLARHLPHATKVCAFHRELVPDLHTPQRVARRAHDLAQHAASLGFEVHNLAYEPAKLETVYNEMDLHVGYRVHGHLYFLSQRKPSVLLVEDSRGRGILEVLGTPGVYAIARRSALTSMTRLVPNSRLKRLLERSLLTAPNPAAAAQLESILANEIDSGFARFIEVPQLIDRYFETMRSFICSLP